jgi:hypothetical protein
MRIRRWSGRTARSRRRGEEGPGRRALGFAPGFGRKRRGTNRRRKKVVEGSDAVAEGVARCVWLSFRRQGSSCAARCGHGDASPRHF